MLKGWKKFLNFSIINMHKNSIAKAQSRVRQQKGARLNKENLTILSNQAAIAFPERAEKNLHVANATGEARQWRNHPKNPIIFQLRNLPK